MPSKSSSSYSGPVAVLPKGCGSPQPMRSPSAAAPSETWRDDARAATAHATRNQGSAKDRRAADAQNSASSERESAGGETTPPSKATVTGGSGQGAKDDLSWTGGRRCLAPCGEAQARGSSSESVRRWTTTFFRRRTSSRHARAVGLRLRPPKNARNPVFFPCSGTGRTRMEREKASRILPRAPTGTSPLGPLFQGPRDWHI